MAGLTGDNAAEVAIATTADPGGVPVISLSGELDSSNVDELQRGIADTVDRVPERVVFDLSDLRFMDSAAIAVLVGVATKVETVQLRNPSPIVRRIVEVTGLSEVLRIEP